MKSKCLRAGTLLVAGGGLLLAAGCAVYPDGRVGFAPVVVAPAPVYVAPPVVEVEPGPVLVPDGYVWDGYEYVGLVGDQYYYLGPGNVWLVAEPWRLERFHGWEREHPDWRGHLVRNDRFRRDAHGVEHARREERRPEDRR
jgi:hypothetical protein